MAVGGTVALTISVDVLELRIRTRTGVSSGIFRMGHCCTYFTLLASRAVKEQISVALTHLAGGTW